MVWRYLCLTVPFLLLQVNTAACQHAAAMEAADALAGAAAPVATRLSAVSTSSHPLLPTRLIFYSRCHCKQAKYPFDDAAG